MRFIHPKVIGISILLILIWGYMAYKSPESFLKPNNLENLAQRIALYGIIGIGAAFVIITSGIDLSIGSVVCLAGCLFAYLLEVEYKSFEVSTVQSVSAEEDSITVYSHGVKFQPGDLINYDKGKTAQRGTYSIERVEELDKLQHGLVKLHVDQDLRKDDVTGEVARGFPISNVIIAESEKVLTWVEIDGNIPGLQEKDRVTFLNKKSGRRETSIRKVERDGNRLRIAIRDPGKIDNTWYAILQDRMPRMAVLPALVLSLGICALIGLIHGLLITRLNIQPFVVTLCALLIYRGISRWALNDQMIGFGQEYDDSIRNIAVGKLPLSFGKGNAGEQFGIPYPVFITLGIVIVSAIFLNLTIWGRHLYSLGRNEIAARYSGVRTHRLIILAYVICSFLAGVAGILFLLYLNSASPSLLGREFELYAIAAAVLGGCSLKGGEGGVFGVIVGTALIVALRNLTVLFKMNDQLELAILGSVILIGVIADESIRRIAAARKRTARTNPEETKLPATR